MKSKFNIIYEEIINEIYSILNFNFEKCISTGFDKNDMVTTYYGSINWIQNQPDDYWNLNNNDFEFDIEDILKIQLNTQKNDIKCMMQIDFQDKKFKLSCFNNSSIEKSKNYFDKIFSTDKQKLQNTLSLINNTQNDDLKIIYTFSIDKKFVKITKFNSFQ